MIDSEIMNKVNMIPWSFQWEFFANTPIKYSKGDTWNDIETKAYKQLIFNYERFKLSKLVE